MSKKKDIAGLAPQNFVGRRVRLVNQHGGHLKGASLISVASKFKVVVKPDGHRKKETVSLDRVHPWWSQNPDLKEEHEALIMAGQIPPEALVEDEPEEQVTPVAATAPTLPPATPVSKHTSDETILPPTPAMEVAAGSDPEMWALWQEEVTKLREAMWEEKEITERLEVVKARKRRIVVRLKELGVIVKGNV